ncbi:MAG: RDD family protein [Acidobacteriota bacterium]
MSLLRPGAKDPRHIVTREAFEVAPELLGQSLASPWRRGVALLADLLCVFFLTQLGSVSAALAATIVCSILVFRQPIERRWLRWTSRALGLVASFGIFLLVLIALEWSNPNPYTGMSPEQWAEFGKAMGEQDPEQQAAAMSELIEGMTTGAAAQQMQPMLDSFDLPPEARLELEELFALGQSSGPPTSGDEAVDPEQLAQMLDDYAAALRAGEEATLDELGQRTAEVIAAGPIAQLEKRIERLRMNVRELYVENGELREEVENPSFLRAASGVAADLGLTLGWSGVYFSLFLAWGRGRTPGKWLLGLRVRRLDDRPLSLWGAFERFAGYTAGLATGLFGFLQILWDPNRQGIQDKIVGTVVVSEPRSRG